MQYELNKDDVDLIGMALRNSRDQFRSYEHDNSEEELFDVAVAARIQELLDRAFPDESEWPETRLAGDE